MNLTQNEIERELSDLVPHGVRRDIARETGTYESVIYGQYNADDERKSPAYQLLHQVAVMDALHPEVGQAFVNKPLALREVSRPGSGKMMCPDVKMGIATKELAEVVVAHCEGKPYQVKLTEVMQAMVALTNYKNAIIDEHNALKDAGGDSKVEVLRSKAA